MTGLCVNSSCIAECYDGFVLTVRVWLNVMTGLCVNSSCIAECDDGFVC